MLTASIDTGTAFVGTSGNDTFNALDNYTTGGVTSATFTALDSIDGGAGNDTLNITQTAAFTHIASATVANIETANVSSGAGVTVDSRTWTGLTNLNVNAATGAVSATAANTTDVTIGAASTATTVAVTGGKTVTINNKLDTAGDSVAVDGAVDVNVTVTDSIAAAGGVTLGATTANTGAVTVQASGAAITAATVDHTLDTIAVTGGTSITVNQDATSDMGTAATDTAANTVTLGAVTITGSSSTTTVSVTQDEEVTAVNAVAAVAGVAATKVVTFGAMTAGETMIVDGLTFTATKALTAAEVAEAFAGLSASDRHDAGGKTANGLYTGITSANFTSGAAVHGATTSTVTFTEVTPGSGATITLGGSALVAATQAAGVTGVSAVTAVTGKLGVVNGAVIIDDNATATKTITTVTVDGYGAGATLGGTNNLNALTDLTLANSDTGTAAITTNVASLNLTVNDVANTVTITDANLKTVNLTTTGADSSFGLANATIETLNVSGTKAANLTASTLAALKTVTVSGSAGITLDADEADTITSINTSATTGTVTSVINGQAATYTGGAGVDNVTLSTTAPTKAIALGAGNDKVTLASGTTAIGANGSINGGADTDTVVMVAADAVTASLTTAFAGAVTGFERLTLTGATGAQTVDVAKLGNYNYVTMNSAVAGSTTTLSTLTSGATIALNDATATIDAADASNVNLVATITDATLVANTSDVLNIAITANGIDGTADNQGTITAAGVETVNISVTDGVIQTPTNTAADAQSLTLTATSAKTINITGDTAFTLGTAANTAVTLIDGSAATGALTIQAAGTVASTIKGGSGADTLKGSTSATAAAQVSTITLTDGTVNGLGNGDTMSVTVGGTTFTTAASVGDSTMDTAGTALAALIDENAAYTASYNAGTNVITVTAAVAGVPFTLAGYTITDAVVTNATGTALTYDADAAGTNAAAQYDTIAVTQDDIHNGNETVTVTYDADGSGAGALATVAGIVLTAAATKATVTSDIVTALNANAGFSAVATASSVSGDLRITYKNTQANTAASVAVDVGSTTGGLAFAGAVTTAAVQDVDTLVVADAFVASKALDKGDVVSVLVDTDGAGGAAATTVSYTVATDSMTIDQVMAALASEVATDTSNAATATYNAGTYTLTVTDAASAGTGGLVLSGFTVTDVASDQVVNATGASAAFATTTANITATPTADVLDGGAGNDTLVAGTLTSMTGGAGNDTFDMTTQLSNVNSYATITDLSSGDKIETASTVFKAAAVTLASTAVFQDYANEAIKITDATDVSWFQFGGDTYVVENDSNSTSFVNGTDDIIKITGLVDLSTASFNTTTGTIEIA